MTAVIEAVVAEPVGVLRHELQILSTGPDLMVSCCCLRQRIGSTWQREPIEIRRRFPAADAIAAWRGWHAERGIEVGA